MDSIYSNGRYLSSTATWHEEDSTWKAGLIADMLERNRINPASIVEVGCGAGGILQALSRDLRLNSASFEGYDISPQAIELAIPKQTTRLTYYCQDLFDKPIHLKNRMHDVLLVIDVFEHVPDYLGFIRRCKEQATFKIFHIPLDIHVSSVIRNSVTRVRYSLGHLHYFTAESAQQTLRDCELEILDVCYTSGAVSLFGKHPSISRFVANVPRIMVQLFSKALAARFLGGYSLLVLTK